MTTSDYSLNFRMVEFDMVHDTPRKVRVTGRAIWVAAFVALSSTWHVGYSIGSVNAAYSPITKFIETEYEERYGRNITSEFVEAIWVTTSAIFPIGGLFGSFVVGPLLSRFGRLKSILCGHIVIVLMSVLLGLCRVHRVPELILVARFGLGITAGAVGTGICPMYVVEVSPKHARGKFGGLIGTGLSIGIFAANTFGLPTFLSNDELWPLLLALTGLPSVLFILLYKTFPESPRELFLENGDSESAIKVLRSMNGTNDVSHILDEMQREKKQEQVVKQLTMLEVLRCKRYYPSLITASVLASAQQLTGMNGISFNLNNAFLTAGLSDQVVPYASVGVTGAVIFLNLVSAVLTERYGRKMLLCLSYSIEAISLLLIIIFIQLQHVSPYFPYLTVISSMGYFCGFALGAGIVTHVINPELFDQASRSAGTMIYSTLLWASFALCVFITPYMLAGAGGFAFVPFLVLAVLTVVFTALKVPETKNKSFSDINIELRGRFSFADSVDEIHNAVSKAI